MASNLLDKIINETTLKFGGRESLVAKVGNEAQSLNYSSQVPSNDQLDLYSSMMQDIEMGQKERIFWILLFSLMVFVAAGGNIVVIHIVSTNKEMKSVTNYFLVNLSLADTMVSTLNVIFNFISMLNSHWPFGNIYCKISNFIAILSISASVFTLTAISCDSYNIIILVVTYLVPILTMAILYYKVGKELWGHQAIGEDVEKQARAMMAKKKIVKMMIVVVIIFALCWLPYHGFFVVNYYLPTIFQDGPLYYQRCYLIMYWLAMSNSMYNPIIIYFMNSKFRHEFKRVLCFICCCRAYSTPTIKGDSSNHHQNYIGAGGGGNNHSIARLISSNHGPSRRLNGNGGTGQHAVSTVARSGDEHRLGKSVSQQSSSCSSSKRSANQHRQQFNGSIEVVISHPGEVDDVHHHQQDDRVKLDHEREPFIKDPSNASGDNSNNNNNNNSNSSSYNTGSGDNFKNDLDSGGRPPLDDSSGTTPARTASGDDMRPTSIGERYHRRQTGQDKVWI